MAWRKPPIFDDDTSIDEDLVGIDEESDIEINSDKVSDAEHLIQAM